MRKKLLSIAIALTICVGLLIPMQSVYAMHNGETMDTSSINPSWFNITNVVSEGTCYYRDPGGYMGYDYMDDDYMGYDYMGDELKEMILINAESPVVLTLAESSAIFHITKVTLGEDNVVGWQQGEVSPVKGTWEEGRLYDDDYSPMIRIYSSDVEFNLREGVYLVDDYVPATVPQGFLISVTRPASADVLSVWAEGPVNRAIAMGIVPEELQKDYRAPTTRAEFCTLAVALYEKVTDSEIIGNRQFLDTYVPEVGKAAFVEIVNGMGEGRFNPDASLTREQAATMLSRLAKSVGKPLAASAPTFNDNDDLSSWAYEEVGQCQKTEIMGGVGGNVFSPKGPYTREQSILTIIRLYDAIGGSGTASPPSISVTLPTTNQEQAKAFSGSWYSGSAAAFKDILGGTYTLDYMEIWNESDAPLGICYSFNADGTFTEIYYMTVIFYRINENSGNYYVADGSVYLHITKSRRLELTAEALEKIENGGVLAEFTGEWIEADAGNWSKQQLRYSFGSDGNGNYLEMAPQVTEDNTGRVTIYENAAGRKNYQLP